MKRKWTEEEVKSWYSAAGAVTYRNPEDANIVVRKPRSLGWTLNWANPKSYILTALILACVWLVISLF